MPNEGISDKRSEVTSSLNKSIINTWTIKTAKSKARERHRCSFSKENDGNKKYQKVKNIIN